MDNLKAKNIDEYIAGSPEEVRLKLEQIRQAIKQSAPQASEVISYGMPAFKMHGVLVYFAAFKKHIGFFPTASGIAAFQSELAGFATSRGTIHFPLDRPIPFDLIDKIVRFRVKEDLLKYPQNQNSKAR
jgi:uncharacterized protein YdhG (YjbR/CyaY superfamily)